MRVIICIIFSLFCLCTTTYAQDVIQVKDSSNIQCKVVKIDRSNQTIFYIDQTDPEVTTKSVPTTSVTQVKYENGKIIRFNQRDFPNYIYIGFLNSFASKDLDKDYTLQPTLFNTIAGGGFGLGYHHSIKKGLGFDLSFHMTAFTVDENYEENIFVGLENQGFDLINNDGDFIDVGVWRSGWLSVGPTYSFNIKNKLYLNANIGLTAGTIAHSGVEYAYTDLSSDAPVRYNYSSKVSNSSFAFGTMLSLSAQYRISQRLGFMLSSQLYSASSDVEEKTDFTVTDLDNTITFDSFSTSDEYNLSLQSFNIKASLIWYLKNKKK